MRVDEATGEWTFLPPGEVGDARAARAEHLRRLPRARRPSRARTARSATAGSTPATSAAVDDDGFIRLAGRAKDLIIRGGHNIDPATIEDALLAHPAVAAAGAVGRPDVHSGEVPVAFVDARAGAEASVAELEAWAADHVPERAGAPRHVEIVDEIPLTAVGKPYKPELRRRAAEHAARDALAGTAVHDRVRAELVDGAVEIRVPRSPTTSACRGALRLRLDLAARVGREIGRAWRRRRSVEAAAAPLTASAWASSAWRAKTCWVVIARCGRPRPRKATVQSNRTATRFLKPVRTKRWTASHSSQAGKPEARTRPTLATAVKREIVASVPLSR